MLVLVHAIAGERADTCTMSNVMFDSRVFLYEERGPARSYPVLVAAKPATGSVCRAISSSVQRQSGPPENQDNWNRN